MPARGHGFPEDRVLCVCMSAPSASVQFHLRLMDLLLITGWQKDDGQGFLGTEFFPLCPLCCLGLAQR